MATTTNYAWETPDDTDLVKDGAAAIRTLGSSIDTTTKALNPSTTLGDIEYRSSTANTNTRLGIGTTGQVLTVAGGVPSWATPAGAGGKVLQVVMGTLTGYTSTTSSTLVDSGLSVSITPSSASSKVLIITGVNNIAKNSGNAATATRLVLLRGSTSIMAGGDRNGFNNTNVYSNTASATLNYLDTPATTSATTYKVQVASSVSGQMVALNDYDSLNTTVSTIIALEIGA